MDTASKKIAINGETIAYLDSGDGHTTLLFIHGAFINKEYWRNQLTHFADQYRIIAPDLPGHGDSTSQTKWTIQNCANDIIGLVEKLSLENIIVIGHSVGSDIMLEVAATSDNIIGIIGIDCFKDVGNEPDKKEVSEFILNLKNDFTNTIEQFAKQFLMMSETDSEISERIISDIKETSPAIGINVLEEAFGYTHREVELLKGLEHPLHLVNVSYTSTENEKLKKHVGSSFEIYPVKGTSHYPMIENPKDFNAALEKAIKNISY